MSKFSTAQSISNRAKACARLAASVALAATLLCFPFPLTRGNAADKAVVDVSGAQQGSRLLRLGLKKSAVLKLPAAAKDVIVGDNELVDVVLKSRDTAYLFARAAGQTNIFFLDAAGRQIMQLELEVTLDTKSLKELLDRSIPGNAIQVDSSGANVVLKGTVADAQQGKTAEDLAKRFMSGNGGGEDSVVNLLKIAEGNQIMLRVRVVELKRTILKQLGINLQGNITAGTFNFDFVNKTIADSGQDVLKGIASFPGSPLKIDATIKALENTGLATVLAEPTLTAVSGAPASFHAGGEYPYSNCSLPDAVTFNYTCTVQFQPYGITLDFTPTVLSGGRIALNIFTEVSDIAPNPYGNQPVIDLRNAQTSIELPSGGSMMLAGLIKNISKQTLNNTPGLRSLPILGALFSSQDFQRDQSELVVIVTPYLVGPTEDSKLATPIDRFNSPTDLQQIFLGRLNRVYGLPGSESAGTYHGQVGHIVD
ncbi:type II and III secretion system protein family protein [Aestuariivirga sp.]|uniref:type II and III secretion system protein family protein n=1 Tax=Aestuariivirga sp. TaxID=2650926 RepID=UPI003BA942EF